MTRKQTTHRGTTIKISQAVRDRILKEANWGETVDDTLRRMLGIANGKNGKAK